jgi:holo-[acyl-carrier protein] synthase
MIYGIGIDIVEIERLKGAVLRWGDHFLRKVYTEREIFRCYGRKDPFPGLAARFAAKEALIKALGASVPLNAIEILNEESGKPYLAVSGQILQEKAGVSITGIHLSLSHERTHAIATVILETTEPGFAHTC